MHALRTSKFIDKSMPYDIILRKFFFIFFNTSHMPFVSNDVLKNRTNFYLVRSACLPDGIYILPNFFFIF